MRRQKTTTSMLLANRDRRGWLLAVLVFMATLSGMAQQKQKFSVESFAQDPLDLSARTEPYQKYDGNGDLYAIIKVTSTTAGDNLQEYLFNFGNMKHIVDSSHDGELWLYVQRNAKQVTISRDGYTTLSKYDLKTTIQPGLTYVMQLSAQAKIVKRRILQFKVTPANEEAVVKVKREDADTDYELWGTVDATGSIDKRIELGTWYYEITAEHYAKVEGRVVLRDSKENFVEQVTLLPNYGYLEVNNTHESSGATIFVNDRKIGTVPYKSKERWSAGDYSIVISNGELYKDYKTTFSIRPGETTTVSPELEADFAQVTLTVDTDAEILLDGESLATHQWSGPLKTGVYSVECRQEGHHTTTKLITVRPGSPLTFQLEAPKPVMGMLYVRSKPAGADIFLDNVNVGKTPKTLDVPVGQCLVKLVKEGYITDMQVVDIAENVEANLEVKLLSKGKEKSSPTQESKPKPEKPKTPKQEKPKEPKPEKTRTEANELLPADCFYIQPALQVGSLMAVGGSVGGYISNFNVEAFYMLGLAKSEDIYWNKANTASVQCTYKPTAFGLRLGYGFKAMDALRLTPQAGITAVGVKCTDGDSKGNATSATLGLRAEYAVAPHFQIFAAPEVSFAVSKSDIYQQLMDVSSKIKSWSSGFNVRLGLSVSF